MVSNTDRSVQNIINEVFQKLFEFSEDGFSCVSFSTLGSRWLDMAGPPITKLIHGTS